MWNINAPSTWELARKSVAGSCTWWRQFPSHNNLMMKLRQSQEKLSTTKLTLTTHWNVIKMTWVAQKIIMLKCENLHWLGANELLLTCFTFILYSAVKHGIRVTSISNKKINNQSLDVETEVHVKVANFYPLHCIRRYFEQFALSLDKKYDKKIEMESGKPCEPKMESVILTRHAARLDQNQMHLCYNAANKVKINWSDNNCIKLTTKSAQS